MEAEKAVFTERKSHCCTVWLSRPAKRNAIHLPMAQTLIETLDLLSADDGVRVVILRGRGKSFCAGADLAWMADTSLPEGEQADQVLPRLFKAFYQFSKPLIIMAHGHSMGGALGILSTADFVLARQDSLFAFSELRLGLIPATISPYIIKRIGEFRARQLMLTARTIGAAEALEAGLVDQVGTEGDIEAHKDYLCAELTKSAPRASILCKQLISRLSPLEMDDGLTRYTADLLKRVRGGDEAREGIRAFRERRPPGWQKG